MLLGYIMDLHTADFKHIINLYTDIFLNIGKLLSVKLFDQELIVFNEVPLAL